MNLLGFFKKQPLEALVDLPTDVDTLDAFVTQVLKADSRLPDTEDTYDNIATMIMHLNQNVSKAPISYFVNGVLKSLANKAAFTKLDEFRKNRAQKAKEQTTAALSLVPTEDTQPPVEASVQPVQNT